MPPLPVSLPAMFLCKRFSDHTTHKDIYESFKIHVFCRKKKEIYFYSSYPEWVDFSTSIVHLYANLCCVIRSGFYFPMWQTLWVLYCITWNNFFSCISGILLQKNKKKILQRCKFYFNLNWTTNLYLLCREATL